MSRPPAPRAEVEPPSGPPMGLIGAVTAVLVAIIAVVVYLAVRGDGLTAQGGADTLAEGGGIAVNPEVTGVPEVHIYADFQCPFCGQLEQTSGSAITEAAAAGEVQLTYTFMSFLDGNLGNDSSSRAANAAVCAADAGEVSGFVEGVFAQQPENEGDGYSDDIFLGVAEDIGIEGADLDTFTTCVQDQTYAAYVQDMQERASKDKVSSSPVVKIDGEPISNEDLSRLLQEPASFTDVVAANS
ncbi:MAG: thioredoxin domain-containing protein [Ornithinimicrobium sp.]